MYDRHCGIQCYISDKDYVWLPANIHKDSIKDLSAQNCRIKVCVTYPNHEQEDRHIASDSLDLKNISYQNAENDVDDMITLNHLHEAAILYNLRNRFFCQNPYTFTGGICIAMNPYCRIPGIYQDDIQQKYEKYNEDCKATPHIYVISSRAYHHMRTHSKNQSILVSGESGAGKTESNKILMNHLAFIAGGLHDTTIHKIIQINPLLESFGNATTPLNDNSSRVGRFTLLQFDCNGKLIGTRCRSYLLEKTRVVSREIGERNFHIFYQLIYSSYASSLFLDRHRACYSYLNELEHSENDRFDFTRTAEALSLIGIGDWQQEQLLQLLAGILHLGQIRFTNSSNNEEASRFSRCDTNEDSAAWCAKLLGLSVDDMEAAICSRTMAVANETVTVLLRKDQASDCRDALAKAIYANIYTWLIQSINFSLEKEGENAVNSIGILDIFGFENFNNNSYEQFCINYANEKLQQKFSHDIFETVQKEYIAQGIQWEHIEFQDNQDVISVIEDRLGIIALLNDEVMRPKGNDESLVQKLSSIYKDEEHLIKFPRISNTQFTLKHYAGSVTYECAGFLEKHKDALLSGLSQLMCTSSNELARDVFINTKQTHTSMSSSRRMSKSTQKISLCNTLSKKTVGTQFKEDLNNLLERIRETNVQYVRCIKPNQVKSSQNFDHWMVVLQLRCAGVVEAIRIARAMYTDRLSLADFLQRYQVLANTEMCSEISPTSISATKLNHSSNNRPSPLHNSVNQICERIMMNHQFCCPQEYQIGSTRIYLQTGVLEKLQEKKMEILDANARILQRFMSGFCCRLHFVRQREAAIKLQAMARSLIKTNKRCRTLRAIVTIQRYWRGYKRRIVELAIRIQRNVRCFLERNQFVKKRNKAIVIQAVFRMKLQRPKYRNALQAKQKQIEMAAQLQRFQKRLQSERNRTEGVHPQIVEAVQSSESGHQIVSSKASSEAHHNFSDRNDWMTDADTIVSELHEEVNRLREVNRRQMEANAGLVQELEKFRKETDFATANYHVKLRNHEEEIREKQKRMDALVLENASLRSQRIGTHAFTGGTKAPVVKRSVSGTAYSSKFDRTSLRYGEQALYQDPDAMRESLAQIVASTDMFLKGTLKRLSSGTTENGSSIEQRSASELVEQNDSFLALKNSRMPSEISSLISLKQKLYKVKEKYSDDRFSSFSDHSMRSSNLSSSSTFARDSDHNKDQLQKAGESLPFGWEAKLSRSKNRIYYRNPELGQTQWKRPSSNL